LTTYLEDILIRMAALLIAITVHEYAHAKAADIMGDPTAKAAGRLSLNPLAHLDPIGFIMLWLFRFGWAKPVPINPFNFRKGRQGLVLVSAAGPAANVVTAFLALTVIKTLFLLGLPQLNLAFVGIVINPLQNILYQTFVFNIYLSVFNLIPIPPLDGSKILAGLLPQTHAKSFLRLEVYGPIVLILSLYLGIIGKVLQPIVSLILNLLDGLTHWLVYGGIGTIISWF
jgi:Zn-dependent protease